MNTGILEFLDVSKQKYSCHLRFCYVIFNSHMFNAPRFNSEKDVSLTFFLL
jgi:hypothetical protein